MSLQGYVQMKREMRLMRKFDRLLEVFEANEDLSWYPGYRLGREDMEEQIDTRDIKIDELNNEIYELKNDVDRLKEKLEEITEQEA